MGTDLSPYPEYRDSGVPWLGDVPTPWSVRKLKYAVRFSGGGTPSKAQPSYWDGDIPWVSPKDMRGIVLTRDHITSEAVSASATSIVQPGAVLLVVRSGILRRTLPVAINLVPVALNQDMKALRPREGLLGPYLRAVIEGNEVALAAEWTKQGATVESVEHEFLANSRVPLPPLGDQIAIVRFLSYTDRRIRRYVRARQELISLLEEQKRAITHHAVSRGLDPSVRLRLSGVSWLGDIPQHWEVERVQVRYAEADERSATGAEELLSVSHLTGVTPRSEKNITMFMAESYAGHKLCREGDVVVNTMWAWMGALGEARQAGIVSPAYAVYRPRKSGYFEPGFVECLLRTEPYVAEFVRRSTGIQSSRLRLYPEQFLRIPLLRPPLQEQTAILKAISEATAELERASRIAQREITLVRAYRTRLVSDVVTGKLDVREAAERLPAESAEVEPLEETDAMPDLDDGVIDEPDDVVEETEA